MRIYTVMTTTVCLGLAIAAAESIKAAASDQPLFQDLSQAQWRKMFPDLGDASPEIAILHVDPKTEATQLLIRTPKALHVRQHWHSANETHTMITGNATFACEGNRIFCKRHDRRSNMMGSQKRHFTGRGVAG